MTISRSIRGCLAALGAVASMVAGPALAQADCAAAKEPDRARCEQDKRVGQACAGRSGEALAACRQAVLAPPPERMDCSRFPEGYGRNKCEDDNLRREIEARCGAKSGDEHSRCYAEVMAKALKR
jgi:hypothetical protein